MSVLCFIELFLPYLDFYYEISCDRTATSPDTTVMWCLQRLFKTQKSSEKPTELTEEGILEFQELRVGRKKPPNKQKTLVFLDSVCLNLMAFWQSTERFHYFSTTMSL